MKKFHAFALVILIIAGCSSPMVNIEDTDSPTVANKSITNDTTPEKPLSQTFSKRECRLNAPQSSLNVSESKYPEIPTIFNQSTLKSYGKNFENSHVYNTYFDGNEDTFYVTFEDVTVERDGGSITIEIGTVHMVEEVNGTPGDQWYSVTYHIDRTGMTRTIGARTNPPKNISDNYVIRCGEEMES